MEILSINRYYYLLSLLLLLVNFNRFQICINRVPRFKIISKFAAGLQLQRTTSSSICIFFTFCSASFNNCQIWYNCHFVNKTPHSYVKIPPKTPSYVKRLLVMDVNAFNDFSKIYLAQFLTGGDFPEIM